MSGARVLLARVCQNSPHQESCMRCLMPRRFTQSKPTSQSALRLPDFLALHAAHERGVEKCAES